jgi:hypothetical protein
LVIEEGGVRHSLTASAFPLVIGGVRADIRLAAAAEESPAAYLGREGDEIFVQPESRGAPVLLNGTPLATSHWLREGDRLEIWGTEITVGRSAEHLRLQVVHRTALDVRHHPPVVSPAAPPPERHEPTVTTIRPLDFTPSPLVARRRKRWPLRPVALISWVLLGLLLILAWFLFTARSVEISVEPPADRIWVLHCARQGN